MSTLGRPKGRTFDGSATVCLTKTDLAELKAAAAHYRESQSEFMRKAIRLSVLDWHEAQGREANGL